MDKRILFLLVLCGFVGGQTVFGGLPKHNKDYITQLHDLYKTATYTKDNDLLKELVYAIKCAIHTDPTDSFSQATDKLILEMIKDVMEAHEGIHEDEHTSNLCKHVLSILDEVQN